MLIMFLSAQILQGLYHSEQNITDTALIHVIVIVAWVTDN